MSESSEPADLGILLTLALRCFVDQLHDGLGTRGFGDLRPPFGVVFRALRDEPLTLTALAAQLGVTKQSAAKVVDEMVAKGLIRRQDSAADGRAKMLDLTTRGRAAMAAALAVGRQINQALVTEVGQDDVRIMHRVLQTFIEEAGGADDLKYRRSRAI